MFFICQYSWDYLLMYSSVQCMLSKLSEYTYVFLGIGKECELRIPCIWGHFRWWNCLFAYIWPWPYIKWNKLEDWNVLPAVLLRFIILTRMFRMNNLNSKVLSPRFGSVTFCGFPFFECWPQTCAIITARHSLQDCALKTFSRCNSRSSWNGEEISQGYTQFSACCSWFHLKCKWTMQSVLPGPISSQKWVLIKRSHVFDRLE